MEEPPISFIEQYVIDTVRKMRMEQGLSQAALAAMIDVSYGCIGQVENPKQRAKYNLIHIARLAKAFNCSPRDFLPEQLD